MPISRLIEDLTLLICRFTNRIANTDKDFAWVQKQSADFDVEVSNISDQYGQLAVQGPKARDLVSELVDVDVSEMKPFDFKQDVTSIFKYITIISEEKMLEGLLKSLQDISRSYPHCFTR